MAAADPDYAFPRRRMVDLLEKKGGIRDPRVLQAMREVPRHRFVRRNLWGQAYGDFALPLTSGQTISQPWVVARMTELLGIEPEHRVLEIGTGSGYQTAVLALLARWVFSLERVPALAREAISRMRELGIENVKIQIFDGTVGWSEMAPFDRVLVTAAAPRAPRPLLEQLAPGGRLLVPEGGRNQQRLALYEKNARGFVERREAEAVAFVPLLGRHGWPHGE
ncbi:MAG TPA: protein-L-isoaspartate(D-aspartate) O-methyltransferase [Thermoanaerobaculia bacterium]|nr:protein-L-isoaspartate(D-aspartate) O-methyltransferase [Thermoanaerobaculia bacterium]